MNIDAQTVRSLITQEVERMGLPLGTVGGPFYCAKLTPQGSPCGLLLFPERFPDLSAVERFARKLAAEGNTDIYVMSASRQHGLMKLTGDQRQRRIDVCRGRLRRRPEMIEIPAITATLNGAIAALKEIGKLAERTKNRDLNEKVLSLQQSLMTASTGLLELSSEIQTLREQLAEAKRTAAEKAQFTFRDNVYWKGSEPFCPGCLDGDGKAVHLTPRLRGHYDCPVCKSHYTTPNAESGFAVVTVPREFDLKDM